MVVTYNKTRVIRKLSTFMMILFLAGNGFSQEQNSNANKEPKTTFIIKINDTIYTLSEGEILKFHSTLEQPEISVRLADFKKFDNENISFDYPKYFSFEFEEDYGYKGWTFDGNNFVIMCFEFDAKIELDDVVNEVINQFGKDNCIIEKVQIKLGKKILAGRRINISLFGQKLTMDYLEIILSDSKSRFIVFQDSKNEDGSDSKESIETMKIIDNSIKYK
ncbi:MAG: hypothetical protein KAT14_08005 [Candidatus Marinimicrobia bacterium]|nr:hypothetical protein [Candidatus Neomarinimicrobiota bacterium]